MAPFRDDQIFIIAPGSQTTLAQLGIPESLTPARFRLRSRMFPAEKKGEFEPVKIRRKEKSSANPPTQPSDGAEATGEQQHTRTDEHGQEWEEDHVSEEGAIWPIQNGLIVDWQCFYALMTHVYNSVGPPFHTPVLLVAEPVWTAKEYERITQFFFEKFKVPAFGMIDSAMATAYAYGVPSATVVDMGFEKADVSCVADFVLHTVGRNASVPECGGEAMTARLAELLKGRKGFTREVCEQLKRSGICEVLPSDVPMPNDESAVVDAPSNPAAAASTGAEESGPAARKPSQQGELPRGPGPDTEVGEEKLEDDEGVLDVASIVTGGNMSEYLARKEREKQDKAAARQAQQLQKKGSDAGQAGAAAAAATRPVRMQNAKRTRNTFLYEDFALHDAMKGQGMTSEGMAEMQSALNEGSNKRQKTPEHQPESPTQIEGSLPQQQEGVTDTGPSGGFKREIEVGPERFQAASGGILDRLADAVYRTIQSCTDINKRSDLWDSMIILGNGSHVRGFKEALLETIQKKYVVSPSSATIFTSELPSNMSTPIATGTNTPQPGQQPPAPHGGVNPLLYAATTAQNPQLQQSVSGLSQSGGGQAMASHLHSSHSQTPTSVKLAKIPEYFPEWKESGYDEASFLGAQVAAKVLYQVDGGISGGYMTRTGYNEQGPAGIHGCML